jgi:hypothetical protein
LTALSLGIATPAQAATKYASTGWQTYQCNSSTGHYAVFAEEVNWTYDTVTHKVTSHTWDMAQGGNTHFMYYMKAQAGGNGLSYYELNGNGFFGDPVDGNFFLPAIKIDVNGYGNYSVQKSCA